MGLNCCKRASILVAEYYWNSGIPEYQKYAERILNCSPSIDYRLEAKSSINGLEVIPHVQRSRWCCCRFCLVCQKAKTNKWRAKLFKVFPSILMANPRAKFLFLTLTIKNCYLNELNSTISLMNKAWDKFARRRTFPAYGYLRSLEITGPKEMDDGSMGAHPHFHCLLMVEPSYFSSKNYLSQSAWADMWGQSLKVSYQPVIDIRRVKQLAFRDRDSNQENPMVSSILEVCKYQLKPGELISSSEWLLGLTEQMARVRSVTVGGEISKFLSQNEVDRVMGLSKTGDECVQVGYPLKVEWDVKKFRYVNIVDGLNSSLLDGIAASL